VIVKVADAPAATVLEEGDALNDDRLPAETFRTVLPLANPRPCLVVQTGDHNVILRPSRRQKREQRLSVLARGNIVIARDVGEASGCTGPNRERRVISTADRG